MAAPIVQVRRSSVAGKIPTTAQLSPGEFAVNTYDGKVYIEQDQGAVGVGTTVIVVNPWSVGLGSTAYNAYFTAGNVGVGSTSPTSKLSVVGDANVTGVVTANKFVGDGSGLTGIVASGSAVAVQNNGVAVGSATTINFGTNLSVTFSSGTATVNAGLGTTTALLRNVTKYTATASQTTFSATYIVGYVDVFLNGIRLSDSEYTATNGTSIVLIEGASLGDIVEIVAFGGANSSSSGISSVSIAANTANSNQLIPYVTSFGSTTGFGATNSFVFNPSTGNLGIGITNPSTKLQVGGVIGFNDSNIKIGNNYTGSNLGSGTNNTFFGDNAGKYTTSGSYNNFFGTNAGYCGGGNCNNFIGNAAGRYGGGSSNNFIGRSAGYCGGGNNNNFFGAESGYCGGGNRNNFIGYQAGFNNVGWWNNFLGAFSGESNTSGDANVFLGETAGSNNTTGSYNQTIGYAAGANNTIGSYNNFFGTYTGISTSASYKVIFGSGSSSSVRFDSPDTNKDQQFAVGVNPDGSSKYWLVGNENFNIGIGTTNPTTKLQVGGVIGFNDSNVKIGDNNTGCSISSGMNNALIGYCAGKSNTSGCYNNFFGFRSGLCNISGSHNNAFGTWAGYANTTGCFNNFFGSYSGVCNATGCYNNFFGYQSGFSNKTGSGNNFFGLNAGFCNIGGSQNNFFGLFSGFNNVNSVHNNFHGTTSGLNNSTGSYNNFFGLSAGCNNTVGSHNNFYGSNAGNDNTIGNYNIAIGVGAGRTYIDASFNTIIGSSSGTGSTTGSYNVILGPQRDVPIKNGSNQLVIGSQSNDWIYGNSSYNVGIGITNPNEKLHIQGNLKFTGSLTEQVYAISGTTPVLEPDNGTIQTWTLSGISTPTDGFSAGQSMTLMIDDGTAYTINWPALNWVGGSAPTLSLTSYTVVELWKVSTTLYGALVGVTTI